MCSSVSHRSIASARPSSRTSRSAPMKPSSCSAAGTTDSSNRRTDSSTSSGLTLTCVTRATIVPPRAERAVSSQATPTGATAPAPGGRSLCSPPRPGGQGRAMQTNELTPERLQHLARLRPEGARVLSVYLNLAPTEFATPAARASLIGSLVDEAGRKVKGEEGLSHDERKGLEDDVRRVRDYLRSPGFSADGAHGLAVFSATPAGVFETVKLPRPVESRVVVDNSPWIEPLAGMLSTGRWAVLLANRRTGRLFVGDRDRLTEVESFQEDVRGQADTGGWSEARFERSQAEEHEDVLRRATSESFKRFRSTPFDHLLIGVPAELRGTVEQHLHASLADRLRGFIELDVEHSSAEDVMRVAAPEIEAAERAHER